MSADNVVDIQQAYAKAERRPRKPKGGAPPPTDPPGGRSVPPSRLPPDAPVKALGVNGRRFYFLNCRDQFLDVEDKDIGRNFIIGMFGGDAYLREQWPKYDRSGNFVVNFDHAAMSPVLMSSCHDRGIWSPEENVRGVGSWSEEGKAGSLLVMHCGDFLFTSDGMKLAPGLRGKTLYPAAPSQPYPEPGRAGEGGPAAVLLDKLATWNWARGSLDAELTLGWVMAAMLGAAPDWRPIAWFTGGTGTGKSTLLRLVRWVFGPHAMIKSEDATPAGVKQRVRDSSLAVSLDEQESSAKRETLDGLIKLARIASSGGESLRGQPGGQAQSFISRNAFQFSSIVIPSMPQQDKNRMFIGVLHEVEWEGSRKIYEPGADEDEDDEKDSVLGSREEWGRIGRQLRGRALAEWSRYRRTLRAYRKALEAQGHNARGCDQFGAIGAAYDLACFDGFEPARAEKWAKRLPARNLPETSGYAASHEACLKHLLGAPIDAWRGGIKESVASLLRQAREEMRDGKSNDKSVTGALEQIGLKLFRDAVDEKFWWLAVSHSSPGLARIFHGTDWSGLAGAPGAWAQMMGRLLGAMTTNGSGNPLKLRFDGSPEYCTALPWHTVFPPASDQDDDHAVVFFKDRSE